ncbi:putative 2-aminoethylphosphonate ABC transporter substrate-binding protein [Paenibacillus alginolyticus]|uniref:2-aminoethylphosphonate ABC transporter substrate-binding protein n=1 Tax=Paenibacillus alginolyticus TaxID=59839 RepID=A0ABT4GMZ9_9BACL|nr:putative 2-aminoethylphosphonate ABC transporter substrate-binding protein [Paenibacillus alginolyticus]MCY9670623.1 putative 2-aminoethylphosphonate ABC transporter substrate-binding protein [Paenibacillus alginolyticus]MCY9697557.1 putative 2-aminoethylphosphonate ABC transporter substrate-binding protein [Paenibacillus alginolyticus]MEC0141861.1 putative 2-aminoethylphosphonate ABC transporter substrate-binding protein [Paenibacillus alginolyticus]
MKTKWKSLGSMLLITGLLAGCGTANPASTAPNSSQPSPAATAATNKPAEITVYSAMEDEQIKTYLTSFKSQYPSIKVNIVRDSTGIMTAKLIAEKENPQADVIWGLAATSLLVMDDQKMLEPYAPKGVEKVLPEFKDKSSIPKWVGIDIWETAIIVNKVEMEKRHLAIPQSYEDLGKPEYKGLIAMPNPASSGTGYLTVNALLQLYGKDKAWTFMDKLHDNMMIYTQSGSKPAKMAASGEAPIGISYGYSGIQEKKKGSPVEVIFPKEGSGWDMEANALVSKKDIKPESKLFLDWAISAEPMKEYNKNYAILSIKQDGNIIPDGYSKDPVSQLSKLDLYQAARDRESVLADWTKKYDSKSEPKK